MCVCVCVGGGGGGGGGGDQITPTNHLPDLVEHEALSLNAQGHKLDVSSLVAGGAAGTAEEGRPTLGGDGRGEGCVCVPGRAGLHQMVWDSTTHRVSCQVCAPERT